MTGNNGIDPTDFKLPEQRDKREYDVEIGDYVEIDMENGEEREGIVTKKGDFGIIVNPEDNSHEVTWKVTDTGEVHENWFQGEEPCETEIGLLEGVNKVE
jgi:hypothetical protein